MEHVPEPVRIGKGVAALIGLLSVAAALAAGHLVAALTVPASSPYLAVGNTAIDLAPQPLKSLAIELFGTADKLALLIGMAVVLALLAAGAGLLSRTSARAGVLLVAILGVLGVVAVLARPAVGVGGLWAPVASLLVGLGVLLFLRRTVTTAAAERAGPAHDENATTAETPSPERSGRRSHGRRRVLVSTLSVATGSAVAALTGQRLSSGGRVERSRAALGGLTPDTRAAPIPPGSDFAKSGTPTFLTPNSEFYRVDTALRVPRITAEQWRLRVHGMVERELDLSFADLRSRNTVEKPITMTCVSNPVGGPYVSTAEFIGVPLRDVLAEAGVHEDAEQVFSTSADGFTAGTPVDVLTDPDRDALLAFGMNGRPLPIEHGFPVRMVTPGLYGYLSATKWVTDLELTTWDRESYWRTRGWAREAPIKTQSRIDTPSGFAKVPAGRVTVAGVAWAQHTGVERVEVRVDGADWRTAELSAPVNRDTWRMWRTELELPPGGHTVESRATDRSGYTQSRKRSPTVPDGATGWHSVFFTAE
ncbi:molybdopterin-dependent oxidoreductase [Actinopolyspora mortivallis]|uniref:Molybdopterin-binding protein n=1 Tax=Actinopolyspora mortivallis TaxID=33906 RepID=A0A2T0GUG2_ACTMO|nr:molybdopterin-dependent oxidoreductase [Actinopolyspora mortivallis]PRW62742.1 molybdopterin-binding protein [Actinopolyspora mortivallis]